ncbi:MAG: fibronectin type III domain-containing protein, partial [Gemmatimonadota bacterium]
MSEYLRTHRRMLAAILAIGTPVLLLTACNDDPLFGIPPDAPTNVSVAVAGTSATVTWTPGAGATSQEVRMSPIVAVPASAGTALLVEDDHVQTFPDNTTSSALFENLTPGSSYRTTVTAIGGGSRVSSSAVTAVIPPEVNAPVLNTLVPVEGDPSSLYMTWTGVEGAENYRVELQAASGGDPFTDVAPASATDWIWDSSLYAIVDGETYTAQVFSLIGTDEFGSNTLQYTTDFFPWDDFFPTSLHETGQGKITYYTAPEGFGTLIDVPYEDADCIGCHSSTDGRPPVSGRTCDRCHDTATPGLGDDSVDDPATCLGCHSRQGAEQNPAFGLNDVHRSAGFTCMDCHTLNDVHGDGTEYASLQ